MLYIASVRHKAAQCPGNDPDLMSEAAEKLSKANLLKKNIEIVDAFIDEHAFSNSRSRILNMFVHL